MIYENAVVLVPGFFGFGRLGSFYYFADRVAACLRGAVESAFGTPTPVMGVATVPAGSLAERQEFLIGRLTKVDEVLRRPGHYHLVGHSAGGVDAELLRAEAPLGPKTWAELDPANVRARIATITTISSPHYGTYLCDSGVVGLLSSPLHHFKAVPEAIGAIWELAKLALDRPVSHEAGIAGVQGWSDSAQFLHSLLTDEKLLGDLRPASMEKIRRERPPALKVPVTCFVSAIPTKPVVDETKERRPDDFILWLEKLTGQVADERTSAERDNLVDLGRFKGLVVRNPRAETPFFEPPTNDGVVNAMTQILRTPGGRLGGVVIADHGDVIGHYDRQDPLTQGTPINDGIFRSGAGFGDDQFFALYAAVARAFRATWP
jgi:hypothetical protein